MSEIEIIRNNEVFLIVNANANVNININLSLRDV